jgi:MFS superfamily sulfate permease-like transporter
MDAALIRLTTLVLASLFEELPGAMLGAVLIDAMVGLVTFADFKRSSSASRCRCC